MWSSTARTPGMFSATTTIACRSASSARNAPEMHDAFCHHGIDGTGAHGPGLTAQFGIECVADGPVVGGDRRRRQTGGQRLQQVPPADDADQPAVARHRHALDPTGLEQVRDLGDRHGVGHRDHIARHDLAGLAAMGLGVMGGEAVGGGHQFQPARRTRLRAGLGAVQQIAFADDAHDAPVLHDRQGADLVVQHQADQFGQRGIRRGADHVRRHHIGCVHRAAPSRSALDLTANDAPALMQVNRRG